MTPSDVVQSHKKALRLTYYAPELWTLKNLLRLTDNHA